MEGGRERAGGGHTAEARGSGSNSGRHISSPPAPREDAFSLFLSHGLKITTFFYLEVEGDTFSSSMWKSFYYVTPDPAGQSFIYHCCDSEAGPVTASDRK